MTALSSRRSDILNVASAIDYVRRTVPEAIIDETMCYHTMDYDIPVVYVAFRLPDDLNRAERMTVWLEGSENPDGTSYCFLYGEW